MTRAAGCFSLLVLRAGAAEADGDPRILDRIGERGYAAFDMFMCGDTEPHKAIEVLTHVFVPKTVDVTELLRGGLE